MFIAEDNGIVILGSDKRGTIYGIYELSRQLGVSPWYWMADAPIARHSEVWLKPGVYTDGEPKVIYRGIFINDKWPSFGTWCNNQFGGVNSKAYAKIFESRCHTAWRRKGLARTIHLHHIRQGCKLDLPP